MMVPHICVVASFGIIFASRGSLLVEVRVGKGLFYAGGV